MKSNTALHRLDPRTKLFLAITYTICALLFDKLVLLLIIFVSLVPFIVFGHLFKKWIKSISGLSFLYLIIIILNTFFVSLDFAFVVLIRITIMISAFSIFFLTVDPNDLALSLISMKIPYEYSFAISLAFRFVPTIAEEAQNIMDAQQSRGHEFQGKNIFNQIKNLFPLLIPLIILSIKRAFNVAEALESRAFGSDKKRTFYVSISFSTLDYVLVFYFICFLISMIFIKIFLRLLPEWLSWSLPV